MTPTFDLPFTLQPDASETGLGAVLSQVGDGVEHPVTRKIITRKLHKHEKNYARMEECVAVRLAMEKIRFYLLGREFTLPIGRLKTMHSPLEKPVGWFNDDTCFQFEFACFIFRYF